MIRVPFLLLLLLSSTPVLAQSIGLPWSGHGHDPQHTGISQVASQPMQRILWQTPVDLQPQYSGTTLYAHYGCALVTRQNTVLVPVKTGATDNFRIEAHSGTTGALLWMLTTDYTLPPHNWTPQYSMALTPKNRVCYAGSGGTVYYRDSPDTASPPAGSTGQLAFYGLANYTAAKAAFDSNVHICTPITSDRYGNIYFGYLVSGTVTLTGGATLQSGIARIAEDGTGSWVAASTAAADSSVVEVAYNQSPALSNDHRTLYLAVSRSDTTGLLLALDSRTLSTIGQAALVDVLTPSANARLMDDGTASPMVGPDGDVYFGVFENSWGANHFRGWLRHFDKTLTQSKPAGAFGWDHTPSVVAASLVPSYQGSSSYLLLSKYNNYAGAGGNGVNRIAVLDPNDTMTDPDTGATVMKEIITAAGVTPDPNYIADGYPNAVREWCVNTTAIDPQTHSAIISSEDGKVYRWDLTANTLSESITLTTGLGEAYTPTVIGVDGTVYAIANATLYAIGRNAP